MQLDTSKLPAVLRDGTAGMSILFRISALLIWLLLVIPFPSCSVCAGDDHAAMGMQYSNSWVKACADALAKGTGGGEEQKGLTHGALAAHLKRNCGPLGGDGTGRPLSKGFGAQADEEGVVVEGAAGGSERDEEESVDSEEFHVRLSGYSTKTWLYHNQSRPLLSECCRKTSCRNDKLPRLAVEVAAGGWMGVCHGGWVRGFGVVVYACFVARLLSTHALDLIHTWPTVPSYLAWTQLRKCVTNVNGNGNISQTTHSFIGFFVCRVSFFLWKKCATIWFVQISFLRARTCHAFK
jgi:hypothetical protein